MSRESISRNVTALLLCLALAGCYTTLGANQSTSGSTTTITSSAVSGSVKFAGGQASISFGAAPAPGAPGGQVTFSRGSGAVLLLGLVVVDAVGYFASWLQGAPAQMGQAPASIAETCSCYGYKPVSGER